MAGYDQKKAAEYNKLRQQGLSDEAAFQQSGISNADADNYVVNDVPGDAGRGTIGPAIIGTGTITQAPSAAAQRESAQFYQGLESSNFERVEYPVKANSNPSVKTNTTYVNTSTEQVTGGGSTTITSGLPKANATSDSIQTQADIKTAEIARYNEENPVTRNSTPTQIAERRAVLGPLIAERNQLSKDAEAAKTPTEPTTTVVPNTTTNVSNTTFSQESTNTPVQSVGGDDPVVNQQQEQRAGLNINQINNAPLSPVVPTDVNPLGPVTNVIAQPDLVPLQPGNSNSLPPVANVIVEPELVPLQPGNSDSLPPVANVIAEPEPVQEPAATPGTAGAESAFNQGALGTRAPEPVDTEIVPDSANQSSSYTGSPASVDPAVDPGARSPFGGAAFNDAAARNPEAAVDAVAAAEAAQQRATEARLREQQAIQAQFQSPANGDWRVKLKLPPSATYLYKDGGANSILAPLAASDGVVFPYMPEIQTTYNANYDTSDLTHSNYRGYFYKSSYVGDISITGVFTAQNTQEANYLLAVIHFFRSATKMFYGSQDSQRGTPPPLVYLFGLGQYQFNAHPCVIRSFNYNLPNDVDYIRTKPNNYNVNLNNTLPKTESGGNPISAVISRLRNALLPKGALPNVPQELITVSQSVNNIDNSTYVPTKITVQINLLPIQTRNQQSQQFSVKGFANGDLLKGGFW